ncbi:MAG: Fic family protein [Patescibacteria group bacterium]
MKERYEKRIPLTSEIVSKITKVDELKGLWRGGLAINPQILGRLKKSVIITSTGASTRIEGAKMTDEEIERFLKSLKSNPPENRDEEEVAGYADLLARVFDNWQKLKLSESLVLSFHEILLHYSKKDKLHKGHYKTKENLVVARNKKGEQVTIFKPTEAWLTKKEMDDVLYWTNTALAEKKLHPILIIANFVFEFLAIHPFSDGNGRLSRALTNLLLLQAGYEYIPYISLEEIIEEKKDDYYTSLRQTQKQHKTVHEDLTPWVHFFLDTLLTQAERAQELMENDDPTKLLSGRQLEIYGLFAGEPLSVMDVKGKLPHIPEVTIKQALSRLVSLKLPERIGLGRGTRYVKSK